jgi:photosystem II stability/assembly factor-like uncharacterized protein
MASGPGLYKTTDSGNSWKLLLTNILVMDVFVDSTDSNTIYVAGSSGSHGKLVKTSDGGGSWKDIYTEPTKTNATVAVAIDPINHLHVVAGLSAGEVIQSQDGGITWQSYATLNDQIYRIIYGPNKRLYVLTKTLGLFESLGSNSEFTNLTTSLTNGYTNIDSNFSSVASFLDLAFDKKQTSVIYLATDAGLVRTVNDGASWNYMKMPVRNSLLRTAAIAVNPQDSNNLYAAVGSTLFKSNNGGVTWETKQLPSSQEVRVILIDAGSSNVIYLGLGVRK